MRLRYAEVVQLTAPAKNALQTHYYRGNSVYDPDTAVLGRTPRGFSTLASLYQSYRVRGSKCVVRPIDSSGLVDAGTFQGLGLNTMGVFTLAATTDTAGHLGDTEQDIRDKSDIIVKALPHAYAAPTGIQTIQAYRSTARMYPAISSRDVDFVATVSANPSVEWFWEIGYLVNGDTASTNQKVKFSVEIDYWVEFFDPKQTI